MTNNIKNKENSSTEVITEKIKNKNELEKIYKFGKTIFSSDRKLKANYLFTAQANQPIVNYAVAVSSKNGNSVWRNRFKRLVRESIEAEKFRISEIILIGDSNLSVIISPGAINQSNREKIFLQDIKPSVLELLVKIKTRAVKK